MSILKKKAKLIKIDLSLSGRSLFCRRLEKLDIDRVFIEIYGEKNCEAELDYTREFDDIELTNKQFHRLSEIVINQKIQSVLSFAFSRKPENKNG